MQVEKCFLKDGLFFIKALNTIKRVSIPLFYCHLKFWTEIINSFKKEHNMDTF